MTHLSRDTTCITNFDRLTWIHSKNKLVCYHNTMHGSQFRLVWSMESQQDVLLAWCWRMKTRAQTLAAALHSLLLAIACGFLVKIGVSFSVLQDPESTKTRMAWACSPTWCVIARRSRRQDDWETYERQKETTADEQRMRGIQNSKETSWRQMSVMCLSDGSHWPATTAEYQKKKKKTLKMAFSIDNVRCPDKCVSTTKLLCDVTKCLWIHTFLFFVYLLTSE